MIKRNIFRICLLGIITVSIFGCSSITAPKMQPTSDCKEFAQYVNSTDSVIFAESTTPEITLEYTEHFPPNSTETYSIKRNGVEFANGIYKTVNINGHPGGHYVGFPIIETAFVNGKTVVRLSYYYDGGPSVRVGLSKDRIWVIDEKGLDHELLTSLKNENVVLNRGRIIGSNLTFLSSIIGFGFGGYELVTINLSTMTQNTSTVDNACAK